MIYPSKICESAGVDIHSAAKVKEAIELLISHQVIDGELKDRADGRGNILFLNDIDMTPLENEINLQQVLFDFQKFFVYNIIMENW